MKPESKPAKTKRLAQALALHSEIATKHARLRARGRKPRSRDGFPLIVDTYAYLRQAKKPVDSPISTRSFHAR